MKILAHKRVLVLTILSILLSPLAALTAVAQDSLYETSKLIANDSSAGYFSQVGYSIATNDDIVVVGAFSAKAAYVFSRTDEGWDYVSKLTVDDASFGFGYAVSVGGNGTTVVIGSPLAGLIYVFSRTDEGWDYDVSERTVVGANGFGYSVSINDNGDTLVVGAPGIGEAYVFTLSGDTWAETPDATLAPDGDPNFFGGSVAIAGNNIVVGAPRLDTNFSGTGKAYVFTRTGDTWNQIPDATLSPGDSVATSFFGRSVAISNKTVVVGTPSAPPPILPDGPGSVHVFRYDETMDKWNPESIPFPEANGLGSSVAISGNRVVVGAASDDVTIQNPENPEETLIIPNAGSAYLFEREGNDDEPKWVLEAKLAASDADLYERFGWAVAMDGSTVAIGASLADGVVEQSGAAYVYTLPEANLPPTADAGLDQEVLERDQVILSGSGDDPNGDPLTYKWIQTGGPHVELSDPTKPVTSFFAPELTKGCVTLTFALTVTEDVPGGLSSEPPATVDVTVIPNNEIHGKLGGKHRHWLYWHKYSFYGHQDDPVHIKLEADPDGWHRGDKATLILKDKTRGVRLMKTMKGSLPLEINTTLEANGKYAVYVFKHPWFWFWRYDNSFEGDYILTLDGTCGKLGASRGCKKK